MAPVAVLTETDLRRRRREALARVTVSEEELRAKAEAYDLDATELATLTELDNLDYLLGGIDE